MHEDQKTVFPYSVACAFQWNYPVINLGRNDFRNCCRTETNKLKKDDLKMYGKDIILNSLAEREKRARMLLGEKVNGCSSCWKIEEKNVRSPRIDVDVMKQTKTSSLSELNQQLSALPNREEKVQFLSGHPITFSTRTNMLEIILKNTCDMQCMYCSHHYSSRWAAERLKYNEIKPDQIEEELPQPNEDFKKEFLNWFREEGVHSVRYINFIGGEPTLIKEFYEISLEIGKILHSKSIDYVTLSVVTNLNSTERVFEKFVQHLQAVSGYFYAVDINISIEAFGARAEYIRHGLIWKRWKVNFEKLIELNLKKIKISMQMATNILSVTSLPDLLEYFADTFDRYKVGIGLRQNLVTFPLANSPMMLTSDFVPYFDKAIRILKSKASEVDAVVNSDFGNWSNYANFLDTIKSSVRTHQLQNDEKKVIREFFNQFDQRRNLNIYSTFPEYKNFLVECGVNKKLSEVSKSKGMKKWIMQKLSTILN